jgi:hypothetical protein
MFVLYAVLGSVWVMVVYRARGQAMRIHYLMGLLLLAKTLTLLSLAGMYHLIRVRGHPEGWSLAYYLFTFLRGLLFFTVGHPGAPLRYALLLVLPSLMYVKLLRKTLVT